MNQSSYVKRQPAPQRGGRKRKRKERTCLCRFELICEKLPALDWTGRFNRIWTCLLFCSKGGRRCHCLGLNEVRSRCPHLLSNFERLICGTKEIERERERESSRGFCIKIIATGNIVFTLHIVQQHLEKATATMSNCPNCRAQLQSYQHCYFTTSCTLHTAHCMPRARTLMARMAGIDPAFSSTTDFSKQLHLLPLFLERVLLLSTLLPPLLLLQQTSTGTWIAIQCCALIWHFI